MQRTAQDHAIFVRFCGMKSLSRRRASAEIASRSVQCATPQREKAQAVLARSCAFNEVIRGIAAAARACLKGRCANESLAKDQDVFEICWWSKDEILAIADEAIESIHGRSATSRRAKDHAAFTRLSIKSSMGPVVGVLRASLAFAISPFQAVCSKLIVAAMSGCTR